MSKLLSTVSLAQIKKKVFSSISKAQLNRTSCPLPRHSIYSAGRRFAKYLSSSLPEGDKKKLTYRPLSRTTRNISSANARNRENKIVCKIDRNKVHCYVHTDSTRNCKHDKIEAEKKARMKFFDTKGLRCTFRDNSRQDFVDFKPIFAKGKYWTRFDNILEVVNYDDVATSKKNQAKVQKKRELLKPVTSVTLEAEDDKPQPSKIIFKDHSLIINNIGSLKFKDLIKVRKAAVTEAPETPHQIRYQTAFEDKPKLPIKIKLPRIIEPQPKDESAEVTKSSLFAPKIKAPYHMSDKRCFAMDGMSGTWCCKKSKKFKINWPLVTNPEIPESSKQADAGRWSMKEIKKMSIKRPI